MNPRSFAAALLALAALPMATPLSAQHLGSGAIAVVSGGIGIDAREVLAAHEKDFNFKLVSTITRTGTYVSDVTLTISNLAGQPVVRHTTQGPLFLARLPDGADTLNATFREQTLTRKFQIRAGHLLTEYLRWPERGEEDWTLPWNAP